MDNGGNRLWGLRKSAVGHLFIAVATAAAGVLSPTTLSPVPAWAAEESEAGRAPDAPGPAANADKSDARVYEEPARAELFLSRLRVAPGATFRIAVRLTLDKGWHVYSPEEKSNIPVKISLADKAPFKLEKVSYPPGKKTTVFGETAYVYEGTARFFLTLKVPDAAPFGKTELKVKVYEQACKDQCLPPRELLLAAPVEVAAQAATELRRPTLFAAKESPSSPSSPSEKRTPPAKGNLWLMLLFGLLGGLILNVMPCVLPVVSIKIFGLVSQSKEDRKTIRRHGLLYALGVWASMMVLAGTIIVFKRVGREVGWGFQFQNVYFTAVFAALVLAFGLSMLGVFEVPMLGLGGVGRAASRSTAAGSFVNGVFAVALATPCTAPILGSALFFALGQSEVVILTLFSAVALGLASPFILAGFAPGWTKIIPKPGNWMTVFKEVMGFLLLGTVVYLLYVLNALTKEEPERFARLMTFMLLTAVACWALGRWASAVASIRAKRWTLALVAAGLSLGGAFLLPPHKGEITWRPFSLETVKQASAAGRPVFVAAGAAWCASCRYNEETVLETKVAARLFKELNYLPVHADFTNRNPEVLAWLKANGSVAVPLYVVIPPGRFDDRIVLPVILTTGILTAALKKGASGAAAKKPASSSPKEKTALPAPSTWPSGSGAPAWGPAGR